MTDPRENVLRIIIVGACVVVDAIAIIVGVLGIKSAADIEAGEKEVKTIVKFQREVKALEEENRQIEENLIAFAQPIGWRERATGSMDSLPSGALQMRQLKAFLDDWSDRLSSSPPAPGKGESFKAHLLKRIADLKARAEGVAAADAEDQKAKDSFKSKLTEIENEIGKTSYAKWGAEGGNGLTLQHLFKELEVLRKAYVALAAAVKDRGAAVRAAQRRVRDSADKDLANAQTALDTRIGNLIGSRRKNAADGVRPPYDPKAYDYGDPDGLVRKIHKAEYDKPVSTDQKKEALAKLRAEVAKWTQKRDAFRGQHKARVKELEDRIKWMKFHKEEAKERREPDGEVLAVVGDRQMAYIDLLRKDRLFRGLTFRVYSLEKGGIKIDKGEVEVVEVRERQSSVVAVTRLFDPSDPIKAGDRIYNEVYEKGEKQYFVFAGELSGKLSNEEVAQILRKQGDDVQTAVDERTTFIVVGEGYQSSVHFLRAKELGVRFLLERSLYEYLGLRR